MVVISNFIALHLAPKIQKFSQLLRIVNIFPRKGKNLLEITQFLLLKSLLQTERIVPTGQRLILKSAVGFVALYISLKFSEYIIPPN